MEVKFCRRCGKHLKHIQDIVYACENNHTLFTNSAPATAIFLLNEKNEVLIGTRAIEPHKGEFDIPGGFVDGNETFEEALAREIYEETGLQSDTYKKPSYLLSALDPYAYQDELVSVLTVIYAAKIIGNPEIKPASDIEKLRFTPLHEIKVDQLCFNSAKQGLRVLKQKLLVVV